MNLARRAQPFCAAAALALMLGGCTAGAAGLVARGAAGMVTRTAAVRMGVSRVLVSDPLLGVAARRGVLQEALYNLTAGGTRVAELTIERGGLIRAGGQPLAMLESSGGQIVRSGRVHGALENGTLYEFLGSGEKVAIGSLRGFIPSRGVRITNASGGTEVHVLQRNVAVEVLQIENGWYLIRLANGQQQWLGPELVALAIVAAGADNDCPEGAGVLVRTSGRAIPFEKCERNEWSFRLETAEGTVVVDGLDVSSMMPGELAKPAGEGAVLLTGGHSLFGIAERQGDVVVIRDERGGVTVADALRLQSPI